MGGRGAAADDDADDGANVDANGDDDADADADGVIGIGSLHAPRGNLEATV